MDLLSEDNLIYILSLITYNPNLFLINKKFNSLYHKSIKRYGTNLKILRLSFYVQWIDNSGNECDFCEKSDGVDINLIEYYSNEELINKLKTIGKDLLKFNFIKLTQQEILKKDFSRNPEKSYFREEFINTFNNKEIYHNFLKSYLEKIYDSNTTHCSIKSSHNNLRITFTFYTLY